MLSRSGMCALPCSPYFLFMSQPTPVCKHSGLKESPMNTMVGNQGHGRIRPKHVHQVADVVGQVGVVAVFLRLYKYNIHKTFRNFKKQHTCQQQELSAES